MISAIFGLLGVLVGGAISFGTQWHFQKRHEKANTFSLMRRFQFLLLDAVNDVLVLNRHLDETIPKTHNGPVFLVLPPISNFHSQVFELDTEVLSLFCDGRSDDFLEQATNFFRYRNSLITLVAKFNLDREELNDLTAPFFPAAAW